MAGVLSQEEIDALLSALSAGEVDAEEIKADEAQKKVKPYDFRRPDKFSKDQVRTLQMLHESYARLLATSFATFLRAVTEAKVTAVQQVTYAEFTRSMPNPTIMSIFDLKPLGRAVLEIGPQLGLVIVERMLGGKGRMPDKGRELTDIEQSILKRVILRALSHIKEAWQNVVDVDATFERLEMNPQFAQLVAPNQMVILVTITLHIAGNEGFMNICLPDILLEPVLSKLSAHYWFASTRQAITSESLSSLKRKVERTKVDVIVELGAASITFRELLNLQVGDVITLYNRADALLPVRIGTRPKFRARPGLIGSKLAVQIMHVEKDGVGEDD